MHIFSNPDSEQVICKLKLNLWCYVKGFRYNIWIIFINFHYVRVYDAEFFKTRIDLIIRHNLKFIINGVIKLTKIFNTVASLNENLRGEDQSII